jgi:hypothetical protein
MDRRNAEEFVTIAKGLRSMQVLSENQ